MRDLISKIAGILRSRQSIGRGFAITTFFNLMSKLLGFVREMIVAYIYGASKPYDIFLAVLSPFSLLVGIGAGTFTSTMVPVYSHLKEESGEEEAEIYARGIVSIIILLSIALSIFAAVSAPFIVSVFFPGFDQQTKNITTFVMRYSSIMILFNSLELLYVQLLRMHRMFLAAVAVPTVLFNPVILLILLLTADPKKAYPLVLAWTVAHGLISMVSLVVLGKSALPGRISGLKKPLSETFALWLPVFLGYIAGTLNLIVDRGFASLLPEGTISGLNYAIRLRDLPAGIITGSLTSVVYPVLADAVAKKDHIQRDRLLRRSYQLITFAYVPVTLIFLFLGDWIVMVVYERGAFDMQARILTYQSLIFYSIGLVPLAFGSILGNFYFSHKDTKTLISVNISSVGVNALLNAMLVWKMKHMGLALATSISATYGMVMLYMIARKRYGITNVIDPVYTGKIFLSAAIVIADLLLIRHFFDGLVAVVVGGASALTLFLLTTRILRVYDVKNVLRMIARWRDSE
ncbi:MAG: putative peptidoglycan lipid flippase [Thermotogota bacterium]|nr:putative peptidoglycan lipid flippase [Thermotogota bacterium]MDK2863865.1 putative peptidoglycan lipid flippase [Thermotogota bacterium]HCZ07134.1 murein biosynthesis integral membrane protein MurJ [Thermotogota bacterium]